jgi:hypothetical protein
MYAPLDARVRGLVLANPWVRTDEGLAQSYFENYYAKRLLDPRFWRKLTRKPATVLTAGRDFVGNLWRSRASSGKGREPAREHFLTRMIRGAEAFDGRMLLLLSGQDLVATEFAVACARWPRWKAAFGRASVVTERLGPANHTFSRREWRDWVAARTLDFVGAC